MIDYGVKINVGGNAPTVMGQLFTISQKLDAIMQKLNSMSSKLGDTFRRTGTSAQQATQKAESGFKRVSTAIGDARQKLDRLNFGFRGLDSRLAGLGLSIGAVDIGRRIINAGGNEEDILARLEFALKDRGKAIAMNNELKAFARRAPIPIQDMRQQAAMLAPVFGDQTMKYFKMLGDVVSGSGGDFGNIAYNFAQIKSMGRTYGIDLRQFAMQNIPIWQELAKVLNVPVEKMEEISTSGKITFDIVAKAFENMTKEGGIYFGAMEARAHTFRGQWQIIGNKMQEIWVKFFEKARPYLQQFSDWVEKTIESFDELYPTIKNVGKVLLAAFTGKILINGIANFIRSLTIIKNLLEAIGLIETKNLATGLGKRIAMTSMGRNILSKAGPIGALALAAGETALWMNRELNEAQRKQLAPYVVDISDLSETSDEGLVKYKAQRLNESISGLQERIDNLQPKVDESFFGQGSSLLKAFKKLQEENRLKFEGVKDIMMKQWENSITPTGQNIAAINNVNTDLSPRGVSGNGGIKNFQITFNSPVVQIDDKHVEGEKYTPEQLGQIAAKEFVNIATQIALR
jgi:tape measure domain-containing protein